MKRETEGGRRGREEEDKVVGGSHEQRETGKGSREGKRSGEGVMKRKTGRMGRREGWEREGGMGANERQKGWRERERERERERGRSTTALQALG